MTKTKQALKTIEKFQFSIAILAIHGLMSDSERDRIRKRMDKWASTHGLRVKT